MAYASENPLSFNETSPVVLCFTVEPRYKEVRYNKTLL